MWGKSSIRCDIWVAVRSDFSETSCYCCELFGSFTGISYFPHKTHNEVHPGKRLLCLNDFPPEKWQTQTKQDTVIPSHLCMCFHLVITEILWELVLTATHHMIWGMFFSSFVKKKCVEWICEEPYLNRTDGSTVALKSSVWIHHLYRWIHTTARILVLVFFSSPLKRSVTLNCVSEFKKRGREINSLQKEMCGCNNSNVLAQGGGMDVT